MTDTDNRARALDEARRALLLKRLRGEGGPNAAVAARGIPRRTEAGPDFPMSFAQERMWFADQMEPGTPLYHVAAAVLIAADADIPTLERALTEVRRRHEALRTVYSLRDGRPTQTILPASPWRVETEDIRAALDAAPDRDAELQRRLSIEGKRPFDLANGPVCRAKAFRISEDDAVLSLTIHHIATDGWAMPVISAEMTALYDAFLAGRPSPLAEPAIQYADYTLWQRDHLSGETLERQLGYWKERLTGVPPLELPGDHPRPAVSTHRGDFHRFKVGAEVTDAVRAVARAHGVTVNMVVMAAFNVLLARWTGQDDVTVGTLLGNRNRKETESMVGVTVNTAATRCDLSGDPTFLELVAEVRRHTLDSDAHQDLPFERVVDALGLERDLARHPVFQVMYFHHTFVASHRQAESALRVRPLYDYGVALVDIHIAQFDLSLATLEREGGLSCLVEYSTDLFERDTILRFCDHFTETLRQVAARPEARVSSFPVMGEGEARRVASEWSRGPAASADAGVPVHRRVAAAAARTPDAPAVVAGSTLLTHAELDARAGRLAGWLRSRGVGPETRVGICAERSPEMVVAVLAVLRAGGAYVPLEPRLPDERLAFLVDDAGVALVLTQDALADRFAGTETFRLDRELDATAGFPSDTCAEVDADQLAYLIYTSGSTGQPKAVMEPHGALASFVSAATAEYGITADDRVLQFASLAFDASVEEIFPALAAGAALVLRTEEMLESVAAFVAGVAEAAVTAASLPTAFWHEVANEVASGAVALPAALRTVVIGGERALPERVAGWMRAAPGVRTVNSYGPTEATVAATAWTAAGTPPRHEVPIGRPMAGVRAFVLDRAGRPTPVGVPGELHLGGGCLARGYLGRPGLTAAAFVPDTLSGEAGARLYRTGDRARWLPDGTLEFLGRVDEQVKLRGFRVEPGEVDAALRADARVRDAVTVVRETAPGQRRLVAYVVPSSAVSSDDQASLADALRAALRARLPEYMVPSAVVVLAALPMTPGGKVDRRALPAPGTASGGDAAFTAPASAVEETLARIWAEVLRVERVGTDDNFFEMGGDSILSIQVISRAAQEGLRITPKLLFQHQTVAALAPHVGTAAEVRAEQGPVVGPAPLTPIQQLFFEHAPEDAHHWNQAFLFALREAVEPDTLRRALAAVADHHDALRLRFARGDDGAWTQRFAEPGVGVPLDVVDLSDVAADARGAALTARAGEIQAGLSLEDGPLLRAALFTGMEDGRPRLLLAIHHLAVDAVSWGIVLEDLVRGYAQLAAGEVARFPAKTSSFRQWAERLAEYAGADELRREAAYWSGAVPSPAAPIPTDRDGANPEGAAAVVQVALGEDETRALLQEVPPVYGTQVNDVLLTALAQAFAGWTGAPSLLIDLEGHGREDLFDDVDLSRTVGWFTSLFPVHLELPVGGGAGEAIKAVKETLRRIPARGIGYGLLRHLSPDPDLRTMLRVQPRAEVSFNYLGHFDGGTAAAEGETPFLTGAAESPGPVRSPRARREHLLEVDAMVSGGRLVLNWWYGSEVHDAATVERLAAEYLRALRGLMEHCKDPTAGGFTPSDFPGAAGMDQDALDALMAQIGG